MNDVVIQFDHVTKTYPLYHHFTSGLKTLLFNLPKALHEMRGTSYTALNDISFEIRQGESVGFIGRNGAGKSTTLGLIAGVLRPTSGVIHVKRRVSPLLELGGGFHPDLTGLENVRLNGVLLGLSRKQVSARLEEIIDFSELKSFIDQPVRTYSSGMMARLGFSVVAHLDPQILLIDEVLAVGDANFQKKCLDKMSAFKAAGITLVLVSHSPDHIKALCDRAICIHNNRILKDGPVNHVLADYSDAAHSV